MFISISALYNIKWPTHEAAGYYISRGRGYHSSYGGVENAIREITLEMSSSGLQLGVCGISDSPKACPDRPHNITLVNCPAWLYKHLGQHSATLYCMAKSLLRWRPRVMVVFASGPNITTPILKLFGVHVISSLRAVDSSRDKWGAVSRRILKVGEYCAWRYADRFTVNSQQMVELYAPRRPDVVFLPNGARAASEGVDRSIEEAGLTRNGYFLFAARLDPVKRLHLLLQAHANMPSEQRLPLVVAGGHSKCHQYVRSLTQQAHESVVFLGHIKQSQLAPLMRHCRAFILPSTLEGMSNSLLSAMAAGKAVLASDIPPNKDVLQDPDALFLKDDVASLSSGLVRLAKDERFAISLGERLRARAEKNHDWASTAAALLSMAEVYLKPSQHYPRSVSDER